MYCTLYMWCVIDLDTAYFCNDNCYYRLYLCTLYMYMYNSVCVVITTPKEMVKQRPAMKALNTEFYVIIHLFNTLLNNNV